MDQRGLEEVLSFCIEEGQDASNGFCINTLDRYRILKNAKQR